MTKLQIWPMNVHVKVFKDTKPLMSNCLSLEGVRNDFVPGQFVIRSDELLESVTVETDPLNHIDTDFRIPIHWNFVGFVPVKYNTPGLRRCDQFVTPEDEYVRRAPCEFPDPLLETSRVNLRPYEAQPVWLTIFVPKNAPSGTYKGRVGIKMESTLIGALNIELKVYAVVLPDERHLKITNWFGDHSGIDYIEKFYKVELWTEDFWKIIKAYARNMSEHRQNIIPTYLKGGFSDRSLIRVFQADDKGLRFDFSRFDRWVKTFMEEGVGDFIEGSHIVISIPGTEDWAFPGYSVLKKDGTIAYSIPKQNALNPESVEFLSQYLPALQNHLDEKNWLPIYLQHIGDEPTSHNIKNWRKISAMVKNFAPKLKIIDAIQTTDAIGYINIWVPILHEFDKNIEFYKRRMRAGDEVWFYTCCAPTGKYPNRFIDFSLMKVRILYWMCFKYEVTGFLHWGFNAWSDDPFQDVEPHGLPPGDAFIVYPGNSGPLNSIRWEIVREGIEDYELLWLLSQKCGKDVALNICDLLIRSVTDYEKDPKKLEEVRRKIICKLI
jgi:hypothetical protein